MVESMARQNDHTRAEELMSAYLDKRVSAEEQSFFERHIALCAACRAQLEVTRSMVTALKAMPLVKAPRSFVLPREMAKQPKRSFLTLYPALRLATVIAAMAFVVLFAGDLLISRSGGSAPQSIPAAAPAPVVMQAPEVMREIAPTQEAQPAEASNHDAAAAPAAGAPPAAASAPSSKAAVTETMVVAESTAVSMVTVTPEATISAEAATRSQQAAETTPEPGAAMLDQQTAAEQPTMANAVEAASAPTIDPLRIIEIALLALVIVLGVATLVVRRKQA
jgi:hypothetical protein